MDTYNATCCDVIPLSCAARSEPRREVWAKLTSLAFGRSDERDLWNPQSGSEIVKTSPMNHRFKIISLIYMFYPQTVLALPLSDYFCPGVFVPHRDHTRGRSQAVSRTKTFNISSSQIFPFFVTLDLNDKLDWCFVHLYLFLCSSMRLLMLATL